MLVPQQTFIDWLFPLALLFKVALRNPGPYGDLTRSKNGEVVSRKDVRHAYTRLYRSNAKASLRGTRAGRGLTAPRGLIKTLQAASVDLRAVRVKLGAPRDFARSRLDAAWASASRLTPGKRTHHGQIGRRLEILG